jgi:hypothetical protein
MTVKYNFCTLFDINYTSRGLALYRSLERHCLNFHLYIFAFDQISQEVLTDLNLEHATIISLNEFEDEELLRVKPTRSRGEYCWTCTSSTILYCLEKFNLPMCTYVDADIYFFSDPTPLFQEMSNKSVLITPHWYSPGYDQTKTSGIYCVQFIPIKNNELGMKVLRWWRNACLEWCYNRVEEGKFGDQKYLDTWPEKFEGIHVLENRRGGVAPWNVQQYSFEVVPIFYHFHALKFLSNIEEVDLGHYKLSSSALKTIYKPYIEELLVIHNKFQTLFPNYSPYSRSKTENFIRKIIRKLKGHYNVYKISDLLG